MRGSPGTPAANRWLQLIVGIICMVMIANLQYGWTLFVHPMAVKHGWPVAEIQVAFSLFVALETWLTPIEGWIVDRIGAKNGPRLVIAFGGMSSGSAGSSIRSPVHWRCSISARPLSGIGAGAIYATCVGNAVKWFPDRRGLAVGLDRRRVRRRRGADRGADPRGDRGLRL